MGAEPGPSSCSGARAAIAPHAKSPTSAIRMRSQAKRRNAFSAVWTVSFCLANDSCIFPPLTRNTRLFRQRSENLYFVSRRCGDWFRIWREQFLFHNKLVETGRQIQV